MQAVHRDRATRIVIAEPDGSSAELNASDSPSWCNGQRAGIAVAKVEGLTIVICVPVNESWRRVVLVAAGSFQIWSEALLLRTPLSVETFAALDHRARQTPICLSNLSRT